MEEKVLISGQSKKSICVIIVFAFFVPLLLYAIGEFLGGYYSCIEHECAAPCSRFGCFYAGKSAFSCGISDIFDYITGILLVVAILGTIITIIAFKANSCRLSVSESKITGRIGFNKSVNIPLKNIQILNKHKRNGIAITSDTKIFKFLFLKNRDEIYNIIRKNIGETEVEKKINEIIKNGFKKRCNVCGKIICYTIDDLKKNKDLQTQGMLNSISSIAGALSGHYAASSNALQTSYDLGARIVDYNKCPSCGSRELVDITSDELEQLQKSQQSAATQIQQLSSADELKKYKELLDDGVITQEEFEQKKKQLLGL